jgi:Flp pilus assembly protein TadD
LDRCIVLPVRDIEGAIMSISRKSRLRVALVLGAISLLLPRIQSIALAGEADSQVCDVKADFALGIEDYAAATRLHREIVRKNPDNALAHYHLGFAEGMIGDRSAEIGEYQRARALGLRTWDLFLNLGLAQLETRDLEAASNSLRKAVLLGEEQL